MKENEFLIGKEFLTNALNLCDIANQDSVMFEENSGKQHPKTIEKLGDALSLIYRSACCYWGCVGGDHLIERLLGKVANQAISSFKLYRMCYYDESLMVTRGIGEIANLLHLFIQFPEKIEDWKTQNDRDRYVNFSPSKVRKLLEQKMNFVPIDKKRYGKLCEVGTHPNPNEIPGHYTGTEIPILGMVLQPVGAYVTISELGYATGLVLVTIPKLLESLDAELKQKMKNTGIELIRNLGGFNIVNYHENLKIALAKELKKNIHT